jgi:hypothetical protein
MKQSRTASEKLIFKIINQVSKGKGWPYRFILIHVMRELILLVSMKLECQCDRFHCSQRSGYVGPRSSAARLGENIWVSCPQKRFSRVMWGDQWSLNFKLADWMTFQKVGVRPQQPVSRGDLIQIRVWMNYFNRENTRNRDADNRHFGIKQQGART